MTRIDLERRECELHRALSAATAPEEESRLLVELADLAAVMGTAAVRE